ncbi:MAG: chemotaxis protein CheA [Gemmatimonadaceae bacterium]
MSLPAIDDIAILLLQLEIDDVDDLAKVRNALVSLLKEKSATGAAASHLIRAVELLGNVISTKSENATDDLVAVGVCLELAMNASSDEASDQPLFAASLDSLPEDSDAALLREFVGEGLEYIVASESALLSLENNPDDREALDTVFRAFHTVKGTSAFLGLSRAAAFAHEAESLLSRVRDKEFSYSGSCAELALRSIDMLRELLQAVEVALDESGVLAVPAQYDELTRALKSFDPSVDVFPIQSLALVSPEPKAAHSDSSIDATIRVRTDRLDRLLNIVGELVIAQTIIAGDSCFVHGQQPELTRKVAHAGKIVRELQELSMSMRTVPLRATFQKLARVVRDTSSKTGKSVNFVTDGDEVEIDRNLVDLFADPLIHMVRNAVDHGIESPIDRETQGKPRTGQIHLTAYHSSGNVVVELTDDGRGLSREKIVLRAIANGTIASDANMSDSDVFDLAFAPGFSTAEVVTDISGRGVGLDVVRRNLETVGGRIDINSTAGKGSKFTVRLPFTLAVTDGMLVRVGAERYVLPLAQIQMSFRPDASMLSTIAGRGEVVLQRGTIMPVVRLHRLFNVPDAVDNPLEGLLVIVNDGDRRSALLVDELLGQQQVVAKRLGNSLGQLDGFSGGAILGDGRVALILDVRETIALNTPPLRLAS